jgi:hypothetical protein
VQLDLSSNQLGGAWDITSDVTSCVASIFLYPIPESLSQLQALTILSLGDNELPGAVNMFGTSPVMSRVYIASKASLLFLRTGPIPESISQLQSLTALALQRNKLSGSFTHSSGVLDVSSVVPCVCCV